MVQCQNIILRGHLYLTVHITFVASDIVLHVSRLLTHCFPLCMVFYEGELSVKGWTCTEQEQCDTLELTDRGLLLFPLSYLTQWFLSISNFINLINWLFDGDRRKWRTERRSDNENDMIDQRIVDLLIFPLEIAYLTIFKLWQITSCLVFSKLPWFIEQVKGWI